MAFLDDLLGGVSAVGEVMQKPRKWLWGDVLGLPESGEEVLSQKFGMDRDSWLTKGLGFGLETLGDPLTYILPWGAGKLGGVLGRGTSAAGRGGTALAESAVPNLAKSWASSSVDELAPAVTNFLGPAEGASAMARYMGTRPSLAGPQMQLPTRTSLAQPMQSMIPGFDRAPGIASHIPAFTNVQALDAAQASKIDAMLARGKDLAPDWAVTFSPSGSSGPAGWLGKGIQRGHASDMDAALRKAIDSVSASNNYQDFGRGIAGMYDADTATALAFKGANDPAKTLIHEMGHGITDVGRRLQRMEELPLPERVVARLQDWYQNAPTEGLRGRLGDMYGGLSHVGDELVQHARQGSGLLGALREGTDFVVPGMREAIRNPLDVLSPVRLGGAPSTVRNKYFDVFAREHPHVASLYRAAGNMPYQAPLAFGAGAGGGLLYNLLSGE